MRAGDLARDDLLQTLGELRFPAGERPCCWLDAPDGWTLDDWRGPTGIVCWNTAGREPRDEALGAVLPRVMSGRVFAPSGELRWRVLSALGKCCCRVVFLGDGWTSPRLESLSPRDDLTLLTRADATYPLWGQQTASTPGEWIDLRIPHRLRYPVNAAAPAGGRVIANVRVEIWSDRHGEPQFIRLCDLRTNLEN